MFFINSTIQPLHTNTPPKTPVTTIGFGPLFHNPSATTVYPASCIEQRLQQHFQPAITGCQVLEDTTTPYTPLQAKNGYDLSKVLTLLRNLTLKDDTLIALNFSDEITLNLKASIKKSRPILPDLNHIDPSKSLPHLLVPSV